MTIAPFWLRYLPTIRWRQRVDGADHPRLESIFCFGYRLPSHLPPPYSGLGKPIGFMAAINTEGCSFATATGVFGPAGSQGLDQRFDTDPERASLVKACVRRPAPMFVTSLTKHERTPHRALKSSNAPGQLWSCPTRVARTHTPKDRYRDYHSPYSRLCSTNCLYIPAYQSAARPSRVPVTGHQGRGAMTCLRAGNLRQARFAFRGRGLAALRSHSRCLSLALQRTSPERVSSPRPASPDIAIR